MELWCAVLCYAVCLLLLLCTGPVRSSYCVPKAMCSGADACSTDGKCIWFSYVVYTNYYMYLCFSLNFIAYAWELPLHTQAQMTYASHNVAVAQSLDCNSLALEYVHISSTLAVRNVVYALCGVQLSICNYMHHSCEGHIDSAMTCTAVHLSVMCYSTHLTCHILLLPLTLLLLLLLLLTITNNRHNRGSRTTCSPYTCANTSSYCMRWYGASALHTSISAQRWVKWFTE
jgi:hypothetical protein